MAAAVCFVLFSCGEAGGLQHPPDDSGTIGRWRDGAAPAVDSMARTEDVNSRKQEAKEPQKDELLNCLQELPVASSQAFFSKNCDDPALCPCGPSDLGRVIEFHVDEAAEELDLCVMELQDFSVSDAVIAAHKRGVTTRVVLDDGYADPEESFAVEDLHSAGLIPKSDKSQKLMHAKFALVDGETVLVSSANFSTYDARSNANNLIVFRSAGLAAVFEKRFEEMWSEDRYHQVTNPGPFVVSSGGHDVEVFFGPHWALIDRLVEAIEGADETIHFSIFAFTLEEVKDALLARCGEVELLGVYDSSQKSDQNSVVTKGWCGAADVRESAVVNQGDVPANFGFNKLHHKLLIVDPGIAGKELVITGSANWSFSAATNNDEAMIVVHAPWIVEAFESEFQARFKEAK